MFPMEHQTAAKESKSLIQDGFPISIIKQYHWHYFI